MQIWNKTKWTSFHYLFVLAESRVVELDYLGLKTLVLNDAIFLNMDEGVEIN